MVGCQGASESLKQTGAISPKDLREGARHQSSCRRAHENLLCAGDGLLLGNHICSVLVEELLTVG